VLVGDDAGQRRAALARLEAIRASGGAVVVSAFVLAELAWVLSCAYGYDRARIAAALRGVVGTPPFVAPARAVVLSAITAYEHGAADFADYLIIALGRAEGATTFLTFDRRMHREADCEAP
jgi:predicted nucleic-acid-binding protein